MCQGGTKLDGANAEGNSLQADALKVSGNLFIRDNFTSRGAIDLVDAEVVGNLECRVFSCAAATGKAALCTPSVSLSAARPTSTRDSVPTGPSTCSAHASMATLNVVVRRLAAGTTDARYTRNG